MNALIDRNGLSQSRGVAEGVRRFGTPMAVDIVRCHERFLADDHEAPDVFGHCHYRTRGATLMFSVPKAAPWFAMVRLPQEL